jgi:hypothetical protein
MYLQKGNPFKKVKRTKAKGGGTTKVCLPKAKIASMSQAERQKVIHVLVKVLLLVLVAVVV